MGFTRVPSDPKHPLAVLREREEAVRGEIRDGLRPQPTSPALADLRKHSPYFVGEAGIRIGQTEC